MTNDEAIYVLKNTAFLGWSEQAEKVSEAVRMAVEALKRETSGDAIDRQAAIRIASGYCHFTNVAKELEKLPSVQPVAKDINVSYKDAISRQDAIDAVDKLSDKPIGYLESAIDVLVDLPSVQPDIIVCADCKHWVCHDKRCGYWNHGVQPMMWCSQAERRWKE